MLDEQQARECPNCGAPVPWGESHYSGSPAFGYQCERPAYRCEREEISASAPSAPPTLLSEAECEAMRPRYEHFSEVLKLLATVTALRTALSEARAALGFLEDMVPNDVERALELARSRAAAGGSDGE